MTTIIGIMGIIGTKDRLDIRNIHDLNKCGNLRNRKSKVELNQYTVNCQEMIYCTMLIVVECLSLVPCSFPTLRICSVAQFKSNIKCTYPIKRGNQCTILLFSVLVRIQFTSSDGDVF